jgi:RHS repeat-associated protein
MVMAGISSKAAGGLDNKKKYNGIEFDNDLTINTYEAYYRNLDPQIGRWWQIDPMCEPNEDTDEPGLESLTPYNSMANNPVKLSDPLGDWPDWFDKAVDVVSETVTAGAQGLLGAVNAYTSDNIGGIGRVDGSNLTSAFQTGQKIGDVAAVITGAAEDVIGGVSAVLTGGGSAPVSAPLLIHGTGTVAVAIKNLATSSKQQTGSYTNTHTTGKTYSGKGPEKRANESAKRVSKENNDPVKKVDWKPSKNSREAFKAEDKRIRKNGGAGNSKRNYNKVNSPGKKYNKQDKQ